MDWTDWIGKTVFIKLESGRVFTYSKVLTFEDPFISITDNFGYPVTINIKKIEVIREENNDKS